MSKAETTFWDGTACFPDELLTLTEDLVRVRRTGDAVKLLNMYLDYGDSAINLFWETEQRRNRESAEDVTGGSF